MGIRKKILAKRDSLAPCAIKELSRGIQENLYRLDAYNSSRLPLLFYSFRSEAHTHPIIEKRLRQAEKTALPRTIVAGKSLEGYLVQSTKQLRPGAFSIMEPDPSLCKKIDPSKLDIVIVPGSVFDRRGGRFGYGGGFYDRFLLKEAPQAVRIALAFSFQVLDNDIPVAAHDQFMDFIVTEKEIILCNRTL